MHKRLIPSPVLRAQKQKRYRERVKLGQIIVPLPVDRDVCAFLIAMGWLRSAHAKRKSEIADAMLRMLRDAGKHDVKT